MARGFRHPGELVILLGGLAVLFIVVSLFEEAVEGAAWALRIFPRDGLPALAWRAAWRRRLAVVTAVAAASLLFRPWGEFQIVIWTVAALLVIPAFVPWATLRRARERGGEVRAQCPWCGELIGADKAGCHRCGRQRPARIARIRTV